MTATQPFDFGNTSVSNAYDGVLVPLLFEPWAERLLETLPPERFWSVLDLATGTGIVASKLAGRLASAGSVIAADVSAEMLALAKRRCSECAATVRFVETPAHPLQLNDGTVDAVYCQQGFQFFPDKSAAAGEMYRVLRSGGKAAVSTWCPLDECEFFGLVCNVLRRCQADEIAEMMSVPFNFMPADELAASFSDAGFQGIATQRCEMDLVFQGGINQALETAYATPIGPRLVALPSQQRAQFDKLLVDELMALTSEGVTQGRMASLVMTAEKPRS